MRSVAFVLISLLTPVNLAWADWAIVGAAFTCSKNKFSLNATVQSSGGNISAPKGMRQLKIGRNNLSCQVGGASIRAAIDLSGPGHNGACGDPGTIGIMKFQINGKDVVEPGDQMLFYCDGAPTVLTIDVSNEPSGPVAKVCRGLWDWGNSFKEVHCQNNPILTASESAMPNPSINTDAAR
jgi:hypothetical protein